MSACGSTLSVDCVQSVQISGGEDSGESVRFVGAVGAVGGSWSVTAGVVTATVWLSTKLPDASAARTLTRYVVSGVRSRITNDRGPIAPSNCGAPFTKSV